MKKPSGREQAEALEASLAEEIGDYRFIPYLQVHEFEALVLVEPSQLLFLYEVPRSKIEGLCEECTLFATPEDINHAQHSHPKHRIKSRVPSYDENVAGPLLAKEIGLAKLRGRCPHFGQWLSRCEQLDAPGS